MQNKFIEFGKDKTAIIKGFAIVFMIVLHCFGGQGWYDTTLAMNNNEGLIHFMESLKICVGIFTFMVGYGYAFSKDKNFSYSWHHIKNLLISYWVILFGFTVPFCLNKIGGGEQLILNAFGIKSNLSWVNWFIHFYIWSMLIMPFVGRLIDRKPYLFGAFAIILAFVGEFSLHQFVPAYQSNCYLQTLFNCLLQTPTMIFGYIVARQKLFQRIKVISLTGAKGCLQILGVLAAMLAILFVRSKVVAVAGFNFDFFYAPLMIACILYLYNAFNLKWSVRIMTALGNNSVYMWFFHGLFFTGVVRSVYQPMIMVSDNLWIISLWTISLSYICSVIIKKIVEY